MGSIVTRGVYIRESGNRLRPRGSTLAPTTSDSRPIDGAGQPGSVNGAWRSGSSAAVRCTSLGCDLAGGRLARCASRCGLPRHNGRPIAKAGGASGRGGRICTLCGNSLSGSRGHSASRRQGPRRVAGASGGIAASGCDLLRLPWPGRRATGRRGLLAGGGTVMILYDIESLSQYRRAAIVGTVARQRRTLRPPRCGGHAWNAGQPIGRFGEWILIGCLFQWFNRAKRSVW